MTTTTDPVERWREGVNAWLKEHGVPTARGSVFSHDNVTLWIDEDDDGLEPTRAYLDSSNPVVAIWNCDPDSIDDEADARVHLRTQSGWESLSALSASEVEESLEDTRASQQRSSSPAPPAPRSSVATDPDPDPQMENQLLQEAAHALLNGNVGRRHPSPHEIHRELIAHIRKHHGDKADRVERSFGAINLNRWAEENVLKIIRLNHREAWRKDKEAIANAILEEESDLAENSLAVLTQIVKAHLSRTDADCASDAASRPIVDELRSRMKRTPRQQPQDKEDSAKLW